MKRWLCGWVRVRIGGLGTERFLNLCKNKGIIMWDIVLLKNGMELSMYRQDYDSCKMMKEKTGVIVDIVGQYGLHTVIFRYRKRQAFMMICFLFLCTLWLASLHLWDIRIENNRYYTDDQIISWLKEQGIAKGIRKGRVDCELLEQQLRDSFERISWSAITVEGTVLRIAVAENYGTLQAVYTETEPADLVASESGIVESVVVRKGISQVKPGDTVEKGQILISGAVPVHDDNGEVTAYEQVHADGDVMLRNSLEYRDVLPAQWDVKQYRENEGSCLHLGINGKYWVLKSPVRLFHDGKRRLQGWKSWIDRDDVSGAVKTVLNSKLDTDPDCTGDSDLDADPDHIGNSDLDADTKHIGNSDLDPDTDRIGTGYYKWYLPEQKLEIVWYQEKAMRYEIIHLWRSEAQARAILQKKLTGFIKNLDKNEIVVVENQIRIYYDAVGYHADGRLMVLSPQKAHRPLDTTGLLLYGHQYEKDNEEIPAQQE